MAKTKRNTKNILKKVQFQVQYTGLLLLQWYLFSMIFLICPPPFIRLSYTILSLCLSLWLWICLLSINILYRSPDMPSPARGCKAVRIKLLDLCQRTQPSHSKHTQTIRKRCRRGNAGSWEILTAKSNYHRDLGEITDYPPLPCTPLLRDYIRPWARDALLLTIPFYFDCRLIVMTSLTLYIAFSTKYTIMLPARFE